MNFMYYFAAFVYKPSFPEEPVKGELLGYMIKVLKDMDPDAIKHLDSVGNSTNNTKAWLTVTSSLLALSRMYPGAHITLREECLEAEQYLMYHFMNGKSYLTVGEIAYPPFDPEELR